MEIDQPHNEYEAFDLEGYISNYTGNGKINRLTFIADHAQGTPLELEALKMAATELKKTSNTKLYRDIALRINGRAGPEYEFDADWVSATDARVERQADNLDSELNVARQNLVKESVRMNYSALGDLLYNAGDLQGAFKQYMRSRDYCTTAKHIINMCLNIIRCSIETKNFMHVANYVQKAEATPEVQDDAIVLGKLACAMGINHLASSKYRGAANKFTDVPQELATSYSDILSPADIATYGALCAMASYKRAEIKSRVIENAKFRDYLDAAPEMRDAVQFFYTSRYTECLNLLDRIKPHLLLDIHLREHVGELYKLVRARALTLYVAPYSTLDLAAMAEAFNTDVGGLEKEVAALIASKEVDARIDSHAKVLCSRKIDQRAASFRTALKAAEEQVRATKALMLRASMIRFDLIQRPTASAVPERQEERGPGPSRHGRFPKHSERGGEKMRAMSSGGWSDELMKLG